MHGYWLTRMLKFGEERQIKKIIVIKIEGEFCVRNIKS